ncbi:nitrate reductase subunit alpha [Desulfofustis limnaeus]|jgi:nitrate reductase alpha subunit|uniref:nitrate reductase (quinone) n=1 Tax=Desulfofustis limnaeus TaxID=2740163 RepID=A0ABM7WB34_9BACT|nr:nitrate reductase subunit alpha [Desulfofustis limnaeus]MDX9895108.1 nitrate reductase subunit alpha [Desulfofustis sp.]BDD88118.1 nitrate reductase subunit alpha [Desulfofustis limnaeus]
MSWITDIIDPKSRSWEEFYRNRHQVDKVVRSTHGVNCTGSCSWFVHVKDGIVGWELQATDYPALEKRLPPYEPRGCQRGITFSWYLYSPLRIKYPYLRGVLADQWRAARAAHDDPVAAWAAIVADQVKRQDYQRARGKGGFRRSTWQEVEEIIAAAVIHTIKTHGADRLVGFSPIPAMSMLSFAGGSRLMQLLGGANLSFYDWYCDLPNASPEVWGEQTDVAESADWFNSKFIAVMGSNPGMTRTPDVHFLSEARHNGSKVAVLSPDFSMSSKFGDQWIPVHAGQDGAFWMAVNHVLLSEFHHRAKTPYFLDYLARFSDCPFLVRLDKQGTAHRPGRMLSAASLATYRDEDRADFKYLVWDSTLDQPRMPLGTLGFRWQQKQGDWNLQMRDGRDGDPIVPLLTLLDKQQQETLPVVFDDFSAAAQVVRDVPVRSVDSADGRVMVTTVYDLLMAQFGVDRGLDGAYPSGYDDAGQSYTPAWQEQFTGIDRATVIQFARDWATTAERTEGKCSIIIGAGVNHWYHANLIYRAGILALVLCGCVGRNGGGLNHYVGQEKLAPIAPWSTIMGALDWTKPPRFQNAPSYHYVHTDQWRYERTADELQVNPSSGDPSLTGGHTIDHQIRAVRLGWMPFYPQFDRSPAEVVRQAESAGAQTNQEVVDWAVRQLKDKNMKFAVEDPDAPENWPRLWIIWRGNALMASAKGHEYFLKHYLGTHHNSIAPETARESLRDAVWREPAPEGKLDLVVDINFRMDTSALYSDIILPTATWYEKDDLNSSDMHSFIHPLQAAVPPCWESRSDWDIFKSLALRISELAEIHLPEPIRDLVAFPLGHDTPAESAQLSVKDWSKGECEPIPGKTMPNLVVVERDYRNLYRRFISYGPKPRAEGIGAHGLNWPAADFYDELLATGPTETWGGHTYPSLITARDAANVILHLAPETNGEVAQRAFAAQEQAVGLPLTDLAEKNRSIRTTFADLDRQPRRLLTSPCWSGLTNDGRAYTAYSLNVERLVPWRTLTGRQHCYLDHESYIAFGEHLPTYKPKPDPSVLQDLVVTTGGNRSIMLNYLTPHSKWSIHSTYGDNPRMLTLSRGCYPFWINDRDADRIGVADNDWVELYNDHGVVVTRAVVSARLPQGIAFLYHSPERTVGAPRSPLRNQKRSGGHNSLNRIRLKPNLLVGGYGQFTYGWNYWGPPGSNRDTFILVRKLEGEPQW